jgi:hypothetical protein
MVALVILALRRLRQDCEFKASLGCVERTYLNKTKRLKQEDPLSLGAPSQP